jgi:hypothetical protein
VKQSERNIPSVPHRQSEQCIRADLRRMLTEQLEAANKRLSQGPSSTESK